MLQLEDYATVRRLYVRVRSVCDSYGDSTTVHGS